MDQSLVQLMGKRSGKFVSDFVGKIETDAWTFGVKKRQPLVLTSSKGLKLRKNTNSHMSGPMQASSHQCGDLTFSKNSTIPRNILRGLNLSSTDCHRITLTYLDEKPYPRGNRSRHLFQLKIEEQTSRKTLVLEGLFNTSEGVKPKTSGPAVVTETARLNRSNKIVKMTKKLTLKKTQDIFPLTGKFRHSRDDFATKISFNKGLVLEIFIPSVNAWWTFKTHYNQF
jgi:hypothetical protein